MTVCVRVHVSEQVSGMGKLKTYFVRNPITPDSVSDFVTHRVKFQARL